MAAMAAGGLLLLSFAAFALERKVETQEIRLLSTPGGRVVVPKYGYGLLAFRHMNEPGMPHFTVLDPIADRTVVKITAAAPEALETYPIALAVFPDRRRFVVSAATKNYSKKRSLWLLFYDTEGNLTHHERITPFNASLLAVAPDGAVWGLGCNEKTAEDRNSVEPVLYQWSENGRLLNKLLAQRDFTPADGVLSGAPTCPGDVVAGMGSSALAASRDRVVLFDAGSGILAEISASGQVLGVYTPPRRQLPNGKPAPGRGLAVTGDGEIYAAFDRICRFDRATKTWAPVEDLPALAGSAMIFGGAGNQVLRSGESGDRFHFRLVTLK
jgi:hypothetical protein